MRSDLAPLQRLFAALADPTRVRILGLLAHGEVCVCHIHQTLKIPQPKASRHLAYLRRAGLVATDKRGLWVHYRLAARSADASGALLGAVSDAVAKLETVKRDVERLQHTVCCVPGPDAPRRSRRPRS